MAREKRNALSRLDSREHYKDISVLRGVKIAWPFAGIVKKTKQYAEQIAVNGGIHGCADLRSKLKDHSCHPLSVRLEYVGSWKVVNLGWCLPSLSHRTCCSPVVAGSLVGPWYEVKSCCGVVSCWSVIVL